MRIISCLFMLFIALSAVFASESITGTITFLEGSVEITRNGEIITSPEVDVGFIMEMFDAMETGGNGYAEVELNSPGKGSLIRVNPATTFYFEGIPKKLSFVQTTVQLLRGILEFKIGKITRGETCSVQTDYALMAVRGTEFNVDMAQDRSVLVTASEGRVEVKVNTQAEDVIPGTAVVVDNNAGISTDRVPTDIASYREQWRKNRLNALRINASLSIQQYAALWDKQFLKIEAAMKELSGHEQIFRRWESISSGTADKPTVGQVIRDKQAVSRGILAIRSILPMLERTFYTLLELEKVYQEGYADGAFKRSKYANVAGFYRSFKSGKSRVRILLGKARYQIRIFRVMESFTGSLDSGPSIMDTIPSL